MPLIHIPALSLLALAHAASDDWRPATRLAERARDQAEQSGLRDCPLVLCAYAAAAFVRARQCDLDHSHPDLRHAVRNLNALADVDPALSVLLGMVVARTLLVANDRNGARINLSWTEHQLRTLPAAHQRALHERLKELRTDIETAPPLNGDGVALTPAERRVLEFLPTHLTVAEIARRLYVSRNTVKTQTVAIYQKLGVSGRGPAVEAAVTLGLLSN
jgi:LuxR family maltose regulon positive regulatory protein